MKSQGNFWYFCVFIFAGVHVLMSDVFWLIHMHSEKLVSWFKMIWVYISEAKLRQNVFWAVLQSQASKMIKLDQIIKRILWIHLTYNFELHVFVGEHIFLSLSARH